MKWKNLSKIHTGKKKKNCHLSTVLCFKINKSNKNQGTSVRKFELKFALILAHWSVLFSFYLLLCLHLVKRLFKPVLQILPKQHSH